MGLKSLNARKGIKTMGIDMLVQQLSATVAAQKVATGGSIQ